jgi:peptidoglycan hydrolase-like protein with peptidoglycan-binding domain
VHGVDRILGVETGQAVSTFKSQHGLVPADPVVGKGAMGWLDELFA